MTSQTIKNSRCPPNLTAGKKKITNLNHFMQESWLIFNDRNSSGSNCDGNGSIPVAITQQY